MADFSRKLGDVEMDGLITDLTPKTEVRGKTIRKVDKETVYKRGTVFGMSNKDNKLVILGTSGDGETITADCILCDDITVGTSDDVVATVYTAGCFNADKITVADSYELSAEDYDTLRKYGIVFKTASAAN